MDRVLLADGAIDLRCGRWQEVLADVTTCDALICDPPYSARTHEGQRTGEYDGARRRGDIGYDAFTTDDVGHLVTSWAPRCLGWFLAMTSHDLVREYATAMEEGGRYVFAPLPWVNLGGPVRLSGDGPSSWTCWIVVSRPRTRDAAQWGTLPGAYVESNGSRQRAGNERAPGFMGAKPLGLMRAIVRDYTKPGDLVVDPFGGGGTTALACAIEGRRCITSEMDPATFAKAKKRLERGFTRDMLTSHMPKPRKAKQGDLIP